MYLRKFISLFLTGLMLFSSANAHVPEQLGGEGLLQMEATAILLDEKGLPRCIIGGPSEYLTSEKLGEFYGADSKIGPVVFDSLEECDENDELYARIILGAEEINYAMAVLPEPSIGLRALLAGFSLGTIGGCIFRGLDSFIHKGRSRRAVRFGKFLIAVPFALAAFLAGPIAVTHLLGAEAGGAGFLFSLPGNGVGFIICDEIAHRY